MTLPPVYTALELKLRDFTTRDVLAIAILIESRFGVGGGGEHKNVDLLNGIGPVVGRTAHACALGHDILESSDPARPNTIATRFETQSPATIDTEACPFDSAFQSELPGAAMFDPGRFQQRRLLTIETCSRLGLAGRRSCPHYHDYPPITKRFADRNTSAASMTGARAARDGNTDGERAAARLDRLLASGSPAANTGVKTLPAWLRVARPAEGIALARSRATLGRTRAGIQRYLAANDRSSAMPMPKAMSNALVVSGAHTQNGHPLAVFGPQTGYFAPELELEIDAHGGIDLTSWNNAPAPGFYAADNQYSYGPVYRVDMLNARLAAFLQDDRKLYPANLVTILMDAGSTGLRGQEILPSALAVVERAGDGPALTAPEQTAADILGQWRSAGADDLGAMRRDRDDRGTYDHRQAVVLMDAWYNRMVDRALPQLVALENNDLGNVMPLARDNHPGATGSAYQTGYYGYRQRALNRALATAGHSYRQLRCADSDAFADCRQALIDSLDDAIAALGGIDNRPNWDGTQDRTGEYGVNDTAGSDTVEARDMISFRALGLSRVSDILWQNRPTYQQVVGSTVSRSAR